MRYFSMFSGIGGMENGIQNSGELLSEKKTKSIQDMSDSKKRQVGLTCVGFSEIDKYAIQIYKKQYPTHKEYGDASKIDWRECEDFDMLVGGVPCQAWSIAGKRGGFKDSRGTLWYEYFRCLKEKQPSMFLAENVKGILSHNGGNSFVQICECFCELGYAIDFEVLNSKNFGVPQNRQRVFIIGMRLDLLDSCQVF